MEKIKSLAEKGFKFFPCLPTKAPATPNGFYDATSDIERLKTLFKNDDFLIGFPCGEMNFNIAVIDVDINKDGDPRTVDELLDELEFYGKIDRTGFQVQTKSGGRHLYFKSPIKMSGATRYFHKSLAIDFQATGKYVIFPDDKNYIVYDSDIAIDDFFNHLPDLPQWIIDYKKQPETVEIDPDTEILPPEEIREIRSALAYMDSDDRDQWIKAGMSLKSTESPSAYGLWVEWSQTSSKYNPAEMEKRWRGLKPKDITIASLFFEAKKMGWQTTYEQQQTSPDNVAIIKKSFEKKPFPPELLKPPGLVGELMDFVEFKAIKSQPIYALAGSLAAVGALLGRKVRTDSDIRTNVYTLGVGASGSGKEACRSVIKKCFYEAGAGDLAKIDDLASDAAIVTNMDGVESQIFLLDEIGRFLQTTNTAGASRNTHLFNIISVLLKLYSNSNSIYQGKAYADKDKQITLIQPNLCIYGTTIPDTLYKGLTTQSLSDGFMSRMLIFESDQPNPRKKRRRELSKTIDTPKSLLDQIASLYNKPINPNPKGNMDHKNPVPQIVPLNENAMDMIEDFDDEISDLMDELIAKERPSTIYNRTSQLAEQIALIIAGGMDSDKPIIGEFEMKYGITMAKYLADNMMYIAENFVADNEYEHALKWILETIKKFGKISMSKLTHKTQKLKSYERNDILETLINSHQVIESYEGEGVKKTRYLYVMDKN